MVNQVRVFEPFCFLCVSVCLVCACVSFEEVLCVRVSKIFVFVFVFRACRVKNEPTTTTLTFDDFDDFDKFDKGEKKAQKIIQKENKEEVSYLGIFFFKKLGALVYVQRIIHTERSVVQEGLGRNERFS